jgi:outer membrane receptor for ferrienterochelin and colicin
MIVMKTMREYLAIPFALLLVSAAASSQERNGAVTDRKGEAVDLATVALLAGEEHVAVAVTDSSGRFVLSAADGEYTLHVRNIAYKPIERTVRLAPGMTDLGRLEMDEADFRLDEVVVTASVITREADRFVMHINNVPSMLNKEASELLRLAPGVWVDDAGISINGMRGAKVFINERELKLPDRELAAYLRNFHSPDIARIEIIPQAGAEYSADSYGGVVKIILRRQAENGVSGNASLTASQSRYLGDGRPSGTVNARVGALTLHASAAGNIRTKGKGELTSVRVFDDMENNGYHSRSEMNRKIRSATGRLGAVYDLNERNSLGAEVEFASTGTETPSSARTVIKGNGATVNGTSAYRQDENDRNVSATLNYVYRLDSPGSAVKLIVDYTDKRVSGDNDYHSVFEMQGAGVAGADSVYRSNSSSAYKVFATDLSVSKQFGRGMNLSAGTKYTHNRMSDTVLYESRAARGWQPLPDYSFSTDYTEDIRALYGIFAASRGGLSLSAGVRGEYACVKGRQGEIRHTYLDLFPNVSATYSFNAMRTFMLIGQYSRNIQRPDFRYLNPNRIQYSDYSYMIGNPDLRPTYMNRFSLTAVYKYRYVLSAGGTMHRGLIREVCRIDPLNPDVTYIIPENHHTENHYYAALSFPLRPAEWCDVNVNLVGVKQDIRGTEHDARQSHYLYFNHVTTNFTLPPKLFLEVSYSGTSRLYSANSGIEPSHLFHASLKKQFFNDRVTASLGVNNIFDRKTSYFSNTGRFTVYSDERSAVTGRHVKLGLQYHFRAGKSFKGKVVESASETEKERLGESPGIK